MSESYRDEKQPNRETDHTTKARQKVGEPMDDEEKILAGRVDVNLPALLTRDVQGG